MCFGGGKPAAPINRPTYTPDESDEYFDITMEDEKTGTTSTISKRTADQNQKATAGKT